MGKEQESSTEGRSILVDPESGSKYLSARDISNFLQGRDVLAARDVDALCDAIKQTPGGKESLAEFFSEAAKNKVDIDPRSALGLATLKTMQKPEFREIRDFFQNFSAAINQSMSALEKDYPLEDHTLLSYENATVKFNPDAAEILMCHPGFMDPIAKLRQMPPISPQTLERFGRAVEKQEASIVRMGPDKYNETLKDIERNLAPLIPK